MNHEYDLKVNDAPHKATAVMGPDGGIAEILVDGKRVASAAEVATDGGVRLTVDGVAERLLVVTEGGRTWVVGRGGVREVVHKVEAEGGKKRERSGGAAASGKLSPTTPAVVVRVPAEAGRAAQKGEPMVVVSAMKMEITLKAPFDGTVQAVNVKPGDKVNPGDVMVEITPDLVPAAEERH